MADFRRPTYLDMPRLRGQLDETPFFDSDESDGDAFSHTATQGIDSPSDITPHQDLNVPILSPNGEVYLPPVPVPLHYPARYHVVLTVEGFQKQFCLWVRFPFQPPMFPPANYTGGEYWADVWWEQEHQQDGYLTGRQFLRKVRGRVQHYIESCEGWVDVQHIHKVRTSHMRLVERHINQEIREDARDLDDFTLSEWFKMLRRKTNLTLSDLSPINMFLHLRVVFDFDLPLPTRELSKEKIEPKAGKQTVLLQKSTEDITDIYTDVDFQSGIASAPAPIIAQRIGTKTLSATEEFGNQTESSTSTTSHHTIPPIDEFKETNQILLSKLHDARPVAIPGSTHNEAAVDAKTNAENSLERGKSSPIIGDVRQTVYSAQPTNGHHLEGDGRVIEESAIDGTNVQDGLSIPNIDEIDNRGVLGSEECMSTAQNGGKDLRTSAVEKMVSDLKINPN